MTHELQNKMWLIWTIVCFCKDSFRNNYRIYSNMQIIHIKSWLSLLFIVYYAECTNCIVWHNIVYMALYHVQYILYIRGCSKITDFFAAGVTGSLYIREHCCKVSAKNNDRYPPANAVLCLHLHNSTSELCHDTWLSWVLTWTSPTRFLNVNDYFQLFFDKSNKLLRYVEFSILL